MATHAAYPISVEGRLDPQLSRWLWLVKWFLAIPHYIVLAFLWMGFFVASIAAFFAILFTGRYPRALFAFNVGVLRWTWRVSYYSYGALGTDRYPPFTLEDVPDYPARLSIEYPGELSRGLVLVKWWLLAIPHYLIVGVLIGGAYVAVSEGYFAGTGLIEILVLIAAVILLFTGRYPRSLFDFVLGLNRWVLRVAAYAGLMTDSYPPFRLDMGGSEEGGTINVGTAPTADTPLTSRPSAHWGAGSIITVVIGGLVSLLALGLVAGGGVLLWVDRTQRDASGFVTTPEQDFTTTTHALVVRDIDLRGDGPDVLYPSAILGDARVTATAADQEVFIGIARTAAVDRYIEGASYGEVIDVVDDRVRDVAGGALPGPPARETFWAYSTRGSGTRSLTWQPAAGSWSIVVMNMDGSAGVDVIAEAGAEIPSLPWIATGLLIAAFIVGGIAVLIIVLAVRAASRSARREEPQSY